jgi:transcriptional regulator with XRE-family HTH domain
MLNAAQLVSEARLLGGLSRRQTAVMADVSASTISRIELGQLDPTVSMLDRILAACGWRLDESLRPFVDMDAVRAARRLLEPELDLPATAGSESYARGWEQSGVFGARAEQEQADELCRRAAQYASLSGRPGALKYAARDWLKIGRDLNEAGEPWALTGAFAARAYTKVATVVRTTFYVGDVARAGDAAGLELSSSGPYVTLIPFDETTAAGVQEVEGGVRLAAFWQIVIDCFAGNGRMPDQAAAMVEEAYR